MVYILLIIVILIGQLLVSGKAISKKTYCLVIGLLLILLCGLRSEDIGMWDTKTVYLPSFKVVSSHSIFELLRMEDTQYKFIGFDLYSKLIGLLSLKPQFYIFMMALPFYVAATKIICKYARKPMYSFIAILAMGYFTYSFSMIRGMLAFAALFMALDAALEDKWKKMLLWTVIATSFHISSLLFLMVYFIKKIKWSFDKIVLILVSFVLLNRLLPVIWFRFVSTFISGILPTYNYYGSKGGVLAIGMLLVYVTITAVYLMKNIISRRSNKLLVIRKIDLKIRVHKKKEKRNYIVTEDAKSNLLLGMSVCSCVLMALTSVLSEMIRIAMIMGIGAILLIGSETVNVSYTNKSIVRLLEGVELIILLSYFVLSTLPNMHAIPYVFFWQ